MYFIFFCLLFIKTNHTHSFAFLLRSACTLPHQNRTRISTYSAVNVPKTLDWISERDYCPGLLQLALPMPVFLQVYWNISPFECLGKLLHVWVHNSATDSLFAFLVRLTRCSPVFRISRGGSPICSWGRTMSPFCGRKTCDSGCIAGCTCRPAEIPHFFGSVFGSWV